MSADAEAVTADIVTGQKGAPAPSPVAAHPDPLWFKDAVIYQLHVKAFFDSNDDGVGDFRGLTEKLDYIRDLGVNTIWLLPFYPSPMRDDGYDVADYHDVHPSYGSLQDFKHFVREAQKRKLRIITELVINHTSDQHPWFQAARSAPPGSAKRDFYVWSDDPNKYAGTRIIFTDTEKSNWTWDDTARAYYWHRFFSHQPDLNFDNPRVLQAVFRTMRFWLDMGVDGFRLDAIPYLVEREGTSNENLPETHAVIRQIRAALDRHYQGRLLLAEANQWPEDVRQYFGEGDECHMAYHFPLMPRIYMAIAQEDRYPVMDIMQQTPEIPDSCQWAIFLRNHDELTLEMVTSKERDFMYLTYAADPRTRINLGIRRRLAPLMENDPDRIKLMNSLLLSMPGSPIIYYGDEIGMGDNSFLGDRNGVRTPMQWSPDRNAGFSRADPQRLYLPPIMDSVYGFGPVNVEAQARDPSSLLNWMRRMLAVRKEHRSFGRGTLSFLKPGNRKILAYLRELPDGTSADGSATAGEAILCVANLARSAQAVELDLARFKGRVPVEMLGRTAFPPVGDLPYMLTIPAHGFFWFKLSADVEVPSWHEQFLGVEDLPVLVLFDGWASLFRDRVVPWRIGMAEKTRAQFETEALPRYIEGQRWFAAKGTPLARARLTDHALWEMPVSAQTKHTWLLPLLELDGPEDKPWYFVPLAIAWEERDEERMRSLSAAAVAKVRQQANLGLIGDAWSDELFCRAMAQALGSGMELPTAQGKLRFQPTAVYAALAGEGLESIAVSRQKPQSSNTVVALGERLLLKGYRRLRPGINPELEIGRFLTEVAKFPNVAPMAGALEYSGAGGVTLTLATLQAYVANQGDAWNYTLNYLERYVEDPPVNAGRSDAHSAFLALMRILGNRSAELHRALSMVTGNADFDPVPLTEADAVAWRGRVAEEANDILRLLQSALPTLGEEQRALARRLLEKKDALLRHIAQLRADAGADLKKIRIHGDYHLGQVLLTKDDFVIIDFEGEPGRSLQERRAKQSPLRDVAGMLRSFEYAAGSVAQRFAGDAARKKTMGPLLAAWTGQVRRAFLEGYAARGAAAGAMEGGMAASVPLGLLGLFELEKALYEVRYEVKNRPDWASIPLHGVLSLIEPQPSFSDHPLDVEP